MRTRAVANRLLGLKLAAVALVMIGAAFMLVPIYHGVCALTGLNGMTRHVAYNSTLPQAADTRRWITIEFVTSTVGGLPWDFQPAVASVRVHPGEMVAAKFHTRNLGAVAMLGQAVPSVTPGRAAPYFLSVDGLCESHQPLEAGEGKDLPMLFVVDPNLPAEIDTLTLSIAFFDARHLRSVSVPQSASVGRKA